MVVVNLFQTFLGYSKCVADTLKAIWYKGSLQDEGDLELGWRDLWDGMPEWLFWYPGRGAFQNQPAPVLWLETLCPYRASSYNWVVKLRPHITLWIMYLVPSGAVSWPLSGAGNFILLSSSWPNCKSLDPEFFPFCSKWIKSWEHLEQLRYLLKLMESLVLAYCIPQPRTCDC